MTASSDSPVVDGGRYGTGSVYQRKLNENWRLGCITRDHIYLGWRRRTLETQLKCILFLAKERLSLTSVTRCLNGYCLIQTKASSSQVLRNTTLYEGGCMANLTNQPTNHTCKQVVIYIHNNSRNTKTVRLIGTYSGWVRGVRWGRQCGRVCAK